MLRTRAYVYHTRLASFLVSTSGNMRWALDLDRLMHDHDDIRPAFALVPTVRHYSLILSRSDTVLAFTCDVPATPALCRSQYTQYDNLPDQSPAG